MTHIAIRPLNYDDDKTKLEAEIHWLPRYNHGPLDTIPLDTPTLSSRDLQNSSSRNGVPTIPIRIDGHRELLEMQWALNRVLSMSAAAEYQGDNEDDDDDDMPVGEAARSVGDWLGSNDFLQGTAEPDSENSSDEQENSFFTSFDPSHQTTTAVDTGEQSEVEARGATAQLCSSLFLSLR
ncbi:hypothetical protein GX51_03722 [Blastomyces parvus]|uniref:Uncharacterized protein n=1 Tax=Blastomyces parvus TaxID=2060905 RepID=A0A2B7X5P3_9EURO|nr:hypothetical protein GX51_03722 [Blastomyces parvus]